MSRGQQMYPEIFGFILFFLALVLIVPLVSYLLSSSVTSPTEKGFSTLTDRISQVISSSDPFFQSSSVDITLGEGFALYGFDANYSRTLFLSRIGNLRVIKGRGAYSTPDDLMMPKPQGCHTDKACLCLAKECDAWQDDYPECIEWVECASFRQDMVLAGVPYYESDLHSPDPQLGPVETAYDDAGVWAPMNFGLPREKDAFHRRFSEQGMNRSWSDWYGHLYVPGTVVYYTGNPATIQQTGGVHGTDLEEMKKKEGGTIGFYIEKFYDGETTYLLLIPRYPSQAEGISPIDETILDYRDTLLDNLKKKRKEALKQTIIGIHQQAQTDKRAYLDLYEECRRYENTFPNDPSLPRACQDIGRCAPHPDRISDNDCRVNPARLPCVCGEESPSLCEGDHRYCYEKGCVNARQQGECAV